ncbi:MULTISPECIES: endonuclease MutS2 [unclassified Clostridioides]|uniref:endonuclease MutS2 n=1 Tax=unclassified Clostridioides TaxID=2635829 RepID=UPI001D0C1679|nr:endonuclease MutS2 [Clostridioides sp. ES-S-0001-03]MCC0673555.1 endonuclease MutS2 [Clostridioides sp. ES-S-0145-01]MCC0695056.1 endonuclease MutS2 [Clostridioides sp. ES-S-0048-02]UDN59969.1 endonuclease MutS2 [Clostridioides sp. ES-S-0010-02]UDN60458.1 endonuclease MutS2 [Clostridioides sp. ES-W-0016-02]
MNSNTIERLQLNEVKELIKIHCVSSLGRNLIDKLTPSGNIEVVRRKLKENKEARKIIENSNHIPLEGLFNAGSTIDKIEKGMIIEPIELVNIEDFLRGCRKMKAFMLDKEFYSPTLSSYALNITECKNIEEEINYCIKSNKVDSNASKELKKVRRNIEVTEGKIKDRLNKFITSSINKKYIQEFIISKRNDRYVIPIKSSYKNEVDGTILDTSSKGNTVFVEPISVSNLSTELTMLKADETIEEYKILSYLTELIFDKITQIKLNIEILSEYDMVFAKAKYSQKINGITPRINNNGYIKIIKGKHPLLTGDVVPLDFEIGKSYRSLVITGPNAGGKTVTLKTVGLLTLMVQCGFDISAKEDSELSVFEKVFVDIGDNQSIENALSTFSSHIKNIAEIMDSSNNSTLVLFDEIGSGTEPNEGAGLAISLLEEFYSMGCITIASTHYGEIKKFANLHPEFENAGMMFDKETLEPLYKLTIGKSEDSNALFISKKMGIKNKVLSRAKEYITDRNYNLDLVKRSKLKSHTENKDNVEFISNYTEYNTGDKVKLLDENDFGVVYKPRDKFNNVEILFKDNFVLVNIKRLELSIKAEELYPEGYDLNSLFTSFKDRKLEKDIHRGSKKALKQIQREIRENRKQM